MEIDMNKENWSNGPCPKYDCRKNSCKCGLKFVSIPAALGDDSKDSPVAPKNGAYCDAIVIYEANNHVYIYSKEGIPTLVESGGDVEKIIEQLEDQLSQEILDRQAADNTLQGEIDDLKNSPDVVDIVQDYAALQAYDTSKLGDNDIIRVLEDETHDGNSTYYRWDKQSETWTYVGEIDLSSAIFFYADPAETGDTRHIYKDGTFAEAATIQDVLDAEVKGQVVLRKITNSSVPRRLRYEDSYLTRVNIADPTRPDPYCWLFFLGYDSYHDYLGRSLSDSSFTYTEHEFQGKLTAGSNITINNNTISATDTTYSDFTGTDGQTDGAAGLVPAPATTDAGKFLKADGTWDTAGGGGGDTVYSDKTTSNSSDGGAVYIGSLNTNQEELSDPTTTDNHYRYFWALPFDTSGNDNFGIPKDETINIGGQQQNGAMGDISIGYGSKVQSGNSIVIGDRAWGQGSGNNIAIGAGSAVYGGSGGIAIGRGAETSSTGSVALGTYARTSRVGELYIGTTRTGYGYNSTNYRVIGGVHDGQLAQDAVTVNQVNSVIDAINTALSTNIPHIGA